MRKSTVSPSCRVAALVLVVFAFLSVSHAAVVPVAFTELTGITGGTPAGTAVFKADLSGVGLTSILSLTISDNSGGLGGSPGQFSGFDLDAIKLSDVDCATAACAAGLAGLPVFDFTGGTVFAPGTQRVPVDPKLFGTDITGMDVDDLVATLGAFDANSSTGLDAFGFLSMGDDGVLSFNLLAPVDPAGMFLYIGEVGDNGEVAAGLIVVRDEPVPGVPEPATYLLFGSSLVAIRLLRSKSAV